MIRTAVDGPLRTITLDRPARRNALRPAELSALEGALEVATEPVLYLGGAGEAFCAGADLDVVRELSGPGAAAFARHGQRVADALEGYDGAVVAGIDGAARGGGVELALACDLRIATPAATFAETGVALGLFGAWGGTARLPDVVGLGEALDIGLSGRTLSAAEARTAGLVSRVLDDPREAAAALAQHDAAALRTVKARLRDDADRDTQLAREAEAFADLVAGATLTDRNG